MLTRTSNGEVTWTHQPGDLYICTGVTTSGKRFRFITSHWSAANGINIFRGTKWLLRDGKRHIIQRCYN